MPAFREYHRSTKARPGRLVTWLALGGECSAWARRAYHFAWRFPAPASSETQMVVFAFGHEAPRESAGMESVRRAVLIETGMR